MNMIFFIMERLTNCNQPLLVYIDPATTSYLIQICVGIIIAIGTFVGIYRNKIKRFFKKNKDELKPEMVKNNDAKKEVITAEDIMENEE